MCVQRFDDSRNSAIHITYRISLRSTSLREPRDPLSKVVYIFKNNFSQRLLGFIMFGPSLTKQPKKHYSAQWLIALIQTQPPNIQQESIPRQSFSNDPTAGSPTVTLLRLLVPLNDQV